MSYALLLGALAVAAWIAAVWTSPGHRPRPPPRPQIGIRDGRPYTYHVHTHRRKGPTDKGTGNG